MDYNKEEEEETYHEEEEPENAEEEEAQIECKDTRTPYRYIQKNHPKKLIFGDKSAKT